MTTTQKNEILNRVKYGMKVSFNIYTSMVMYDPKVYNVDHAEGDFLKLKGLKHLVHINDVKPYLRRMDDLNEHEKEMVQNIIQTQGTPIVRENSPLIEYLNTIHIDYNNLIANKAAYPAPLEMYIH